MVSKIKKVSVQSNVGDATIRSYQIVKSNDFIQAKSDFTAVQHRIILFALVQIKKTDEALKPYRIKMSEIAKYSNYRLARKALEQLQVSTISIQEKSRWVEYPFIQAVQELKGKEIYFEICFYKSIQRFLLDLRGSYTSYTLANVVKFNKNYSLRIYELCKQHAYKGCRNIKMDFLRMVLSLENKYKKFTHLKRFVLDPSIQEINMHSDISLTLERVLQGGKVTSLNFDITKNELKPPCFGVPGYQTQDGFKVTLNSGFDVVTIRRLITLQFNNEGITNFEAQYSNDRMIQALECLDSQKKPVRNPRGFITKALRLGWVPPSSKSVKTQQGGEETEFKINLNKLVKKVKT